MPTINDYRFESVRLDSYKILPYLWKVEPEKLAAAGFYYTGESDNVKCFMCNVILCEWKLKDDPFADHQRESSQCEFIRNIPCGNVPFGTDPSTIPTPVFNKGIDIPEIPFESQPMIDLPSNQSYENREIVERRAYWLEQLVGQNSFKPNYLIIFSEYNVRLATYDKWPKSKSQAKKLAAAGFCYSGNSDQTICYYCDGRLNNWEPNDDPWAEHAKWFHYCHYLIISKGTEFINNITGKSYIKIVSI
ncbi:PREDICTED: death-associated inhibitor of apoptosis 1-like [Cyphomyrmex costatus]|uniref:Apoptosis inhibitor IAP n=1 Tax=Cyphomyrmex costatus TaxID=456900 RepID=A0A151IEK3_9HYME|nr:PREDICTED: death-associated inhibitor of apoptosis 1-like [Cyphomyrmex costatus]KYM99236.1 Apoptosis inhibitor IAP [Cyphomyrmex costatus]